MAVRIITALSALCILGLTAPSQADDSRVRYRCGAEGASDISMSAKYETRGSSRRKFSVEFEAAPNLDFSEGDKLGVKVGGVSVGSMTLEAIRGGDVVGELNFDTKGNEDDASPFPPKFPKDIGRGTKIRLGKDGGKLLACELR